MHANVEDVISCVVQEAAVKVRGFHKRPPALAGGVVTTDPLSRVAAAGERAKAYYPAPDPAVQIRAKFAAGPSRR